VRLIPAFCEVLISICRHGRAADPDNTGASVPLASNRKNPLRPLIVVFGERHLRHVLLSYMNYYNETRARLSLDKDAPISRAAEVAGRILCRPILGGLHHQYARA
jgi:hypothetical protein